MNIASLKLMIAKRSIIRTFESFIILWIIIITVVGTAVFIHG